MHLLKTASLLLASLTTLVKAVPAPSSCTTVFPAFARVDQAQPVASYLPNFKISQEAGATKKQDTFVEFKVPAGSWGCTLSYYFPAGTPVNTVGLAPVEVFSVAGPLSRSPRGIDISWGYCPAPISMVGTVKFESSPSQATSRVINSFVCAPTMTYRLSISQGHTQKTSVGFAQSNAAGLRMTYNC
ncbi:hypothetical protein BDW59DRAFT_130976 [Aspergillus cavernicola]|uniref:Ubiquitin 3 binding protein But2 C-terminal domain-containing protein n=1 Tax=Aspergillus cavernicola TaxID=176166 RepID=A0ABR4IUV1_9EURO